MARNGRLIINARGETVQVIRQSGNTMPDAKYTLQTGVYEDAVSYTANPTMVCSELALSKQEATALILKLADAIGLACELSERKKNLDAYSGMSFRQIADDMISRGETSGARAIARDRIVPGKLGEGR